MSMAFTAAAGTTVSSLISTINGISGTQTKSTTPCASLSCTVLVNNATGGAGQGNIAAYSSASFTAGQVYPVVILLGQGGGPWDMHFKYGTSSLGSDHSFTTGNTLTEFYTAGSNSGNITFNTATLTAAAISTGGNLSVTNSGAGSISGIVSNNSGNLNLIKAGAGTLTLSGASTYTGTTTINAGTLSVATIGNGGVASGNLGSATNAASNLVIGDGTLQYTGATASTDRNFTITAGTTGTFEISTTATDLTISGAAASTSGALTKTGAGRLILSGANAYTGLTTVSAGALRAANAYCSWNNCIRHIQLQSGAALELSGGHYNWH